jgi:protocatechuate 3,4-dioxygenase beta subunit
MAGGTLRELRAIANGERVDDLFGTIWIGSEYGRMEDRVKSKPLANVVVRAIGRRGSFSAITDEHGAYAFAMLPPGKYRIEANSPSGLLVGQFPAYVKTGKGGGTGCRVDTWSPGEGRCPTGDAPQRYGRSGDRPRTRASALLEKGR